MATQASRTGNRKPSRAAPPEASATTEAAASAEPTLDSTLDAWGAEATREHLAWEIAACSALLRGARALREAQMQAAENAETAHLKAAEQLLSARGVDDFASIQIELLRSDAEGAMQYWTRLSEIVSRHLADSWQEAGAGWVRASETLMKGMGQWTRLQSSLPQTADIVEAEVEHVANPFAASPLVWPAQEAARQAMGLASQGWNEWLSWGSRLTNGNAAVETTSH